MGHGKKFISPNAWFSMIYPDGWNEFEDAEGTFLFYNPNHWTGNFRISAYKPEKAAGANSFGRSFMQEELDKNESASFIKVGKLECAYSKEMFQEEGTYYVTHLWVTGIDNIAFECTFTVPKGEKIEEAEAVIASLELRKEGQKYPAELIPLRVLEVHEINESYEWTVEVMKKQLKKDFQATEDDVIKIQQLIDNNIFTPKQKDAWVALGIAICIILANEVEGMEWMTLIDGNREAPVLKYKDSEIVVDPLSLIWSKIKRGQPCDVASEYKRILESL
ncbi:DUF3805 domain-containing protein [Bacteroides sp. 224]|nr:DUF3805 domain-containing protein [Bacteroides sp. 224]